MQFRILGSVDVEIDGKVRQVPGSRQRTLLAALLVGGGRVMSTEQLYTELWGENPPSTVENSLQAQVYRLRRTLQRLAGHSSTPPALITKAPGYTLDVAPGSLDMNTFRARIAESGAVRDEDPGRSYALLGEALKLWRGTPMQDVAAGTTCQSMALQLQEEYVTALEDRLSLGIDCEDPLHIVGELKRMNAMHPWRERTTELLMLALYRCGRQAEAIEAYNRTRRRLADDLGMEPSVQLRERFREILNQAPQLLRAYPERVR